MNHTGSLAVPRIKRLSERSGKKVFAPIERDFRYACEKVFLSAQMKALHATARLVPVLTGKTRLEYDRVIRKMAAAAAKRGRIITAPTALDYEMTEAKVSQDHQPQEIEDYMYKRRHETETAGWYAGRKDWREREDSKGVRPATSTYFYKARGGQYYGNFYAEIDIEVPHFDDYDIHGTPRGPWNLVEVFDKLVRENLNAKIPQLANHFASEMVILRETDHSFDSGDSGDDYDDGVDEPLW